MKLAAVTIQKFRNFVEPQRIEIEPDVTALVGKNESGKTSILKALHRLNPANGAAREFTFTTEYPRWRMARDRRRNPAIMDTRPVIAEFTVDAIDIKVLSPKLPAPLLPTSTIFASRDYANEYDLWVQTPLQDVINHAAERAHVGTEDIAALVVEETLDAAITKAASLATELESPAPARAATLRAFPGLANSYRFHVDPDTGVPESGWDAIDARVPKFFYFSDYSVLPGEVDLTALGLKIDAEEPLDDQERTLLSLLNHAGVGPEDLLDSDYDSRKAELQAVANELSAEVFTYWRANTDLAVKLEDDNVLAVTARTGVSENHRILKIELQDKRHGDVQTNFATRSTGFQWFFSFFAAFSEYLDNSEPVVVLLDEPGTSLHGEAQKDFIDYIFRELGASKQTLYTTHSQFMVNPAEYEKLRAVHDRATRDTPGGGVEVSPVNLQADRKTVLPIESALGYSISQHLFIGSGHHLLVEGSSDFIYLMRMSAYLEARDRTFLSPKFSLIPVGGIDNMPAFVALMGRRLGLSVLVDGERSSSVLDRTRRAASANGIAKNRIVSVGETNPDLPRDADVEDLFTDADYLKLYNWAFDAPLELSELPERRTRIIGRINTVLDKDAFNHALPAHALTDHQTEFFDDLSATTANNFEALFTRLNEGLSK